ncbi:MAG: FtsK/SpoIIIE domain-containing protein [Verrucomicrobiota bacterium]
MNSEKTVSLAAGEVLRALRDVTSEIASYAEKEAGLARARNLRDSDLRQSLEESRRTIERERDDAIEAAQSRADAWRDELGEVVAERRRRIDRAQITVRNEVVQSIEAAKGAHRGNLQAQYMGATRDFDRAKVVAEQNRDAALAEFAPLSGKFEKLEERAVKSMRGYRGLRQRYLDRLAKSGQADGEVADLDRLASLGKPLAKRTKSLSGNGLLAWFGWVPWWVQIIVVLGISAVVPWGSGLILDAPIPWLWALGGGVLGAVFVLILYAIGQASVASFLRKSGKLIDEVAAIRGRHVGAIEAAYDDEVGAAEARFIEIKQAFESGISGKVEEGSPSRYPSPEAVEQRAESLRQRLARLEETRQASISKTLETKIAKIQLDFQNRLDQLGGDQSSSAAAMVDDLDQQTNVLSGRWLETVVPTHQKLVAESDSSAEWLELAPDSWVAPSDFGDSLVIGQLCYRGEDAELAIPQSGEFSLGSAIDYSLPVRLRVPDRASVLVETKFTGREDAIAFLNTAAVGWLQASPAGRIAFSLIDPIGLGESFAGLMHLADYEELLIDTRIKTQPDAIERRLGELCDHMEKVIQMYLRSDYATISEYNEAAGSIAERYHFLVVADFPNGFTDLATKRLLSIASAGARCGVFLLMHCDQRSEMPPGFRLDDLRKSCLVIQSGNDGFFLKENEVSGARFEMISALSTEQLSTWVHRLGEANRDSNRIEVPFSEVAPRDDQWWSRSTAKELVVPIGRTGASKLQSLALGKGTCQHALIAGKTGSGKSTLFHIIITNLALWCDPDEVEFYLIDFKKGVEFKCYGDHQIPQARVIAIESDREFGLSVLQRLDGELKERGELFRKAGVQDVAGYRETQGARPMPRTLLLIDEFQEFFVEDDAISQQAAVLMDRIVRQGRAFGIHAVLGSQTLGGAFTLARATLGQMTVRIALACNEADAYLIMDDSNPAPRMLTRPGEGIYNDRAGAVEANSPFQVVWLTDQERDAALSKLAGKAREGGFVERPQVVFEGNAPARIESDDAVKQAIESTKERQPLRLFLGAPNAIKAPTEVRFERQSGSHLLIVGQRDDVVDSLVAIGAKVARETLADQVRLVVIDGRFSQPGTEGWFLEAVAKVPDIECPAAHQIGDLLVGLSTEMQRYADGSETPSEKSTLIFIPSLHRQKSLRHEEDFSFSLDDDAGEKPADALQKLISEGPTWGYHVVASLDSYGSVGRMLGRKAAGEFEKKVLFQMSAADSASLIDSGKASDLGMNRALYYDEPSGALEIFRPFAQPRLEWF